MGWPPPDLIRAAGWTLLHFLWQGALIAAVLALALRAVATARARHDLCLLAMAAMAASPVVTFLAIRSEAPIPVAIPGAAGPTSVLWQGPLVGLWAAGVLVLALRAAGGIVLIEGLRRRAEALPAEWAARCMALRARLPTALTIAFRQSREAEGPLLVGWFRPMVLIPTAALLHMPTEQLEALILHEIAHVRRLDAFANLIQTLVETALFYHPAVWWVGARLRIEREHCCDDLAVTASGDVGTYVRALVSMEACRASPQPALAANGGSIRDRAARLLRLEKDAAQPVLPRLAALATLAAGLMLSVYGAGVEAAPDPAAPAPPASSAPARLGPITSALSAETMVVAAPAPAAVEPAPFKVVPPPLPPAPEIRDRAPWVDPSGEAARRLATLDRMIASNREILTSSRDLLAASEKALASPRPEMTEAERIEYQINVQWLPGAIDLAERLLAMRLENREAVVQAESARRDLLAGRAFRADVARTDALWAEMDRKTLALADERVRYLVRMGEARRAAGGEDLLTPAAESLRNGGAMRQAAQRAREAGASYSEVRRRATDGETLNRAADRYRSAQAGLAETVEGVTSSSTSFEADLVRRYRERAAQAAGPNEAIAPQPAAR